jgi:adenylate cyclase
MSERRLAAIMFTDIIGFTSLMTLDERKTLDILSRNMEIHNPLIKKYNGNCIKELGDGTLSCFSSAVNAVKCAMEIQEKNRDDPSYNLRIGIHLGDVIFTGNDVIGNGVNIASRLENSAAPGTIFISGQVYEMIRNIPEIHPEFLGKRELKNVKFPVDIYQIRVNSKEIKLDPGLKTIDINAEPASPEKSILVLPFDDLSREHDIQYLCDGLAEEIISNLSQLHELKLISTTSSFAIKKSGKTLKEIFEERHIQYFLEGGILKSGNHIRINVNLIEGKTDNTVWSSKYDSSVTDYFAFQEDVALSISEALRIKLTPDIETRITHRKVNDFNALEYYLRARQEIFQWSREGLDKAVELLQEGLKVHGNNELLYSGLGTAWWQYINYGYSSDPALLHQMMDCAHKIYKLNPRSPQGFQMLGIINYKYGNIGEAAKMLKASWHFNHNDPVTLYFLATVFLNAGKTREARTLAHRLAEIDPIVATSQLIPTFVHYMEGDFSKAWQESEKVYELFNENPVVTFHRGLYAAAVKKQKQAIEYFDMNFQDHPENLYGKLSFLMKLAMNGSKDMVTQGISRYLSSTAFGDEELSLWMADIYALIGDVENALKWIQNAAKRGFIHYKFFKHIDPFLENIRSDERFISLVADIKEMNQGFRE